MIHAYNNIVRKKVHFCNSSDSVSHVADIMQKFNISTMIVRSDKGRINGIITVGDVLRLISHSRNITGLMARDIMSSPVITVSDNASIEKLTESFKKNRVTRLLVLDSMGSPLGIIRNDAVKLYGQFSRIAAEAERKAFTQLKKYR